MPSLITKPTHAADTSETITDHILTNDSQLIISSGVFSYPHSYHYPTFCTIKTLLISLPINRIHSITTK